jgi:hypothetical protein
MTQFEENNPEQLEEFLVKFRMLIDEYHANIYLMDTLFVGARIVEMAILDELNKDKEN